MLFSEDPNGVPVTPSSSGFYAAMGTPLGPVKINLGDKIKDQFVVKKKIGEGACGQVYLVHVLDKNGKPRGKAAMKVEPLMKSKDDEILKMEIFVLKKIQKRHAALGSIYTMHMPENSWRTNVGEFPGPEWMPTT
ncbi:hypothetical protein ANCCAN_28660 [Ancylostoma caninum]|uniref:Protein kinase domain-containing protein n=2 Tax=Ancylostoma caninum TaxID=29170 RepID=A0A368F0M5_ANCCA|nr:hypothetical protein ANCCAN_28660 [Ancylostoma caninum]